MTTKQIIKKIENVEHKLQHADNNNRYIRACYSYKYWLEKFDESLTTEQRLNGEFSALYLAYFFSGAGNSLYSRIDMSIIDYNNGNRPF